jgi:hypothetical protein
MVAIWLFLLLFEIRKIFHFLRHVFGENNYNQPSFEICFFVTEFVKPSLTVFTDSAIKQKMSGYGDFGFFTLIRVGAPCSPDDV